MMLSEFEKLTGLEVTTAEYEKIEAEYMESPDDKAKFCKMWLKKRGLQRLHNARLEEIEHLKKTIHQIWMRHAMLLTSTTSTTIWMMVTALWWTILSTMMLSTHSMSMTLSTRRCKHVAP